MSIRKQGFTKKIFYELIKTIINGDQIFLIDFKNVR